MEQSAFMKAVRGAEIARLTDIAGSGDVRGTTSGREPAVETAPEDEAGTAAAASSSSAPADAVAALGAASSDGSPRSEDRAPWRWLRRLERPFRSRLRRRLRKELRASGLHEQLAAMHTIVDRIERESRDRERSAAVAEEARLQGAVTTLAARMDAAETTLRNELAADAQRRQAAAAERVRRVVADMSLRVDEAETALRGSITRGVDRRHAAMTERLDRLETLVGALRAEAGPAMAADARAVRQMAGKLVNRHVVPLPHGLTAIRSRHGFLIAPSDDTRLVLLLADGDEYEPGTARLIAALLRPGDTAFDVGANIGALTLPMARAVGADGAVRAFEPGAAAARALQEMLQVNGLSDVVEVTEAAVGARAGEASFFEAETSGLHSLLRASTHVVEKTVRMATLDAATAPGAVADLVKIDVEGAELQVLEGMERLLRENPAVFLIVEFGPEHIRRAGQTIDGWLEAFSARGLDLAFEIDGTTGGCDRLRAPSALSKLSSINLLFARSASSRLARIPSA